MTLLRKSDVRPAFFDGNVFVTSQQRGELVLLSDVGSSGGCVYDYRGAEIHSNASSNRHWFFLAGFPGCGVGSWCEAVHLPVIIAAIDEWLDAGEVPLAQSTHEELQQGHEDEHGPANGDAANDDGAHCPLILHEQAQDIPANRNGMMMRQDPLASTSRRYSSQKTRSA